MGYLTLDYFRKINANLPRPTQEITAVQLNEGSVSGVIDHLSVLDGMVSYDIAHNAPAGSKVNCTVTHLQPQLRLPLHRVLLPGRATCAPRRPHPQP